MSDNTIDKNVAVTLGDLWVDIDGKTKSGLTKNIPDQLKTAERAYMFDFSTERNVNPSASGSRFGAGELVGNRVKIRMEHGGVSADVETAQQGATLLATIKVYVTEDMKGAKVIVDTWTFTNVQVTKVGTSILMPHGENTRIIKALDIEFTYDKVDHTSNQLKRDGTAEGVKASGMDFATGEEFGTAASGS